MQLIMVNKLKKKVKNSMKILNLNQINKTNN